MRKFNKTGQKGFVLVGDIKSSRVASVSVVLSRTFFILQ
jgi:aspartate carbamoyltransferase catalytic subunit